MTEAGASSSSQIVQRRLRLAALMTFALLAAEIVGGALANSLALFSDAGHAFTDVLALALSWVAVQQATRPASARMTYGYHRVGILVAIVNAMSLAAISMAILYAAYQRLREAPEVNTTFLLIFAGCGLMVNLAIIWLLRRDQEQSLNLRSAFLHVVGDALASVGVLIGGAAIAISHAYWVDPIVSIGIALIIAWSSLRILRDGLRIVLEAAPAHVDVDELMEAMAAVPGVRDVHDLHVWSITPQIHALSCHLLVDNLRMSEGAAILERVNEMLARRFGIDHTTIQMECEQCDPNALFCTLAPNGGSVHRHWQARPAG